MKNGFNDNFQFMYCTFITMTLRREMYRYRLIVLELSDTRSYLENSLHGAVDFEVGRIGRTLGEPLPNMVQGLLVHSCTHQIIYYIQLPVLIWPCSAKRNLSNVPYPRALQKVKTTTVLLCPFLKSSLIFYVMAYSVSLVIFLTLPVAMPSNENSAIIK